MVAQSVYDPKDVAGGQLLCQRKPEIFLERVIGAEPWSKQLEIFHSVRDFEHTCVPSCHSIGKDWTAAHVVLWFLYCFTPAIVITTAPTDRQVKMILWQEIAQAYKRSNTHLDGALFTQRLQVEEKWYALGFAAPDYDPTAAQGYHQQHILIVLDEAAGITKPIREAISGNVSSGFARLFEIGNPTDPDCEFAKMCSSTATNTIQVGAFQTPNFTHFGITQKDIETGDWLKKIDGRELPAPHLITPKWVATQLDHEGSWKTAFMLARVFGQFPTAVPESLLDHDQIQEACDRKLGTGKNAKRILACDVARWGDDMCVIGYRQGNIYRKQTQFPKSSVTHIAGALIDYAKRVSPHQIRIDDDGVGGGVTDILMDSQILKEMNCTVVPMNSGSAAYEVDENNPRYYNARAQWHGDLQKRFRKGTIDIDPADKELVEQLKQLRIKRYDAEGRMLMESKDEYKKRVGRSPDDTDTCVMAFANVEYYPTQVF